MKLENLYLPDDLPQRRTENNIAHLAFNSDLRSAHAGLTAQAKRLKLTPPEELAPGEFLVFINRRKNAAKLFAAGNCVVHFKTPDDRAMNPKCIRLIPKYFNGKEFKYDEALEEVVRKEWKL